MSSAKKAGISYAMPGRLGLRNQKQTIQMQMQGSNSEDSATPAPPSPLRKFGLGALWAAFGAYIFFLSPNGDAQAEQALLKDLLSFPPGDSVSLV
jgi:hypothetical protein